MSTSVEPSKSDLVGTDVGALGRVESEAPRMPAVLVDSLFTEAEEIELSIVMPCLNEASTVGACVEKALVVLRKLDIKGEVIVSDNGSSDGSIEIAKAAGARVVHEPKLGYGNAYLKGFEAARGRFIVMADADDTYDFDDIPRFLGLLRRGDDMVIGNRFKGTIMPGAMPWLHRYVGNPVLSHLLNLFFRSGVGDAHCGMRAFTREAYQRMDVQTGGMEFASEMVINSAKAGLRISEVPITYYPRQGESKLRSFKDGWRHLRFMLLYSPTHLYLWPGLTLMVIGFLALLTLALGPIQILGATFGFHWMFVGSMIALLGFQIITLGFFARVFSLSSHIDRSNDRVIKFFTRRFKLEHGLLFGSALLVAGLSNFALVIAMWLNGSLDILESVRLSITGFTLFVIGAQTIFASFFVSMMVIKRRGWPA